MKEFHKVMQQYRVGLLYKENEIVAMLDDSKFQTVKRVVESITEEFGVSLENVSIEAAAKDYWKIKLRIPLEVIEFDEAKTKIDNTESKTNQGWVQLTDKFYYIVEDGLLKIGNRYGNTITPVVKINYEKIKKLYNVLPEKSTTKDLIEKAKEVGVNIPTGCESFVLRVFSRYVDFDAELEKRGKQLYLIKNPSNYLREELRRKLEQEKELIGNVDGAD